MRDADTGVEILPPDQDHDNLTTSVRRASSDGSKFEVFLELDDGTHRSGLGVWDASTRTIIPQSWDTAVDDIN